ncbi:MULTISPECIES: acetolactate synthase small subunit [Sediminispirochaeta]|jgi:acetolactate synthase-1/3 small subunit|uniref:Acetolactate synthase small subunit n=1 Tax=Sediminispirochaeta smaragdinae (strain DSM 11293 / JCM 15392 / SEBR 4228) TaxID=573413 RepID=E1R5W7_SEDSS|nr:MULTISPECIES: acetolactate synthase small subunit [Sediminispirochaeta]ADK80732.1 acetolactate synthase, small subunit [Sediminispirochaeta smaragdinae DSM 11293]
MREEEYTDHTISVLVNNHPGVLSKLTSLITRRGFNIESIAAGPTKDPDMFRLTIIVKGDDQSVEQIQKQLYKIVDTVKVSPIDPRNKVEREIGLIKLRATNGSRNEVLQMVNVFKGQVIDSGPGGFVVEIVGSSEKVDSFIGLFPPQQVVEVARTGIVAMNRWEKKQTR